MLLWLFQPVRKCIFYINPAELNILSLRTYRYSQDGFYTSGGRHSQLKHFLTIRHHPVKVLDMEVSEEIFFNGKYKSMVFSCKSTVVKLLFVYGIGKLDNVWLQEITDCEVRILDM